MFDARISSSDARAKTRVEHDGVYARSSAAICRNRIAWRFSSFAFIASTVHLGIGNLLRPRATTRAVALAHHFAFNVEHAVSAKFFERVIREPLRVGVDADHLVVRVDKPERETHVGKVDDFEDAESHGLGLGVGGATGRRGLVDRRAVRRSANTTAIAVEVDDLPRVARAERAALHDA